MLILKRFTNNYEDTGKYFCKAGSERKDCGMYLTIFLFIRIVNDEEKEKFLTFFNHSNSQPDHLRV